MLIAIFADIHANREAFDACLADAHQMGSRQFIFLGDLVGYGADPAYVVERVAELTAAGAQTLLGNHDAAVAAADPNMNSMARAALDWTRAQLTQSQCAFLAALPILICADNCLFVHAEASQPRQFIYVTDERVAERSLQATDLPITFCGHVHRPQLYFRSAHKPAQRFIPTPQVAIPLSASHQWLAVLGAVGQPRDGNPAAAYSLFDTDRLRLIYCRVAYDIETAADKINRAGLPPVLGARLFLGR
jgi:diadenosine tetraphosphatase ApaH/serine/threonine PP2A family protein phosphatase